MYIPVKLLTIDHGLDQSLKMVSFMSCSPSNGGRVAGAKKFMKLRHDRVVIVSLEPSIHVWSARVGSFSEEV